MNNCTIARPFEVASLSCLKATQKVLDGLHLLKSDADGMYNSCKVAYYALMAAEVFTGNTQPITLTMQQLSGGINIIDFFQTFSDGNYWINGGYKGASITSKLASVAMTVASIGGAVFWFASMGFYKLEAIALKIHALPVIGRLFSTVSAVSFLQFVGGAAVIGYACLAADSVRTIIVAQNSQQRTKGILDLISRVANTVLYSILLSSSVSALPVAALGITANLVGNGAMLYHHYNKEKWNLGTERKEI